MSDTTPARLAPSVPDLSPKREDTQPQATAKKKKPTTDELRQELDAQTVRIQQQVAAIKHEIAQVPDDAKKAVQKAIFQNPWVAVGGSLALGLFVGLVVGKRRVPPTTLSKTLAYVPSAQRHLAERYMDDLQRAARRAARRGENAADAVAAFVANHAPPVIVVEESATQDQPGLGGAIGGILITLLSTVGKTAFQTALTAITTKNAAKEGSKEGVKQAENGH